MRTSLNNGMPRLYCDRTSRVALIFTIALVLLSFTSNTYASESCIPSMARVVSVQGTVELRRADQTNWQPATMNALLCSGDMIRAGSHSSAALRLSNESMLRLDQKTTITFPKIQTNESTSLLDLLNGGIHVITRTLKPFRIGTPYVIAAVDGADFFMGIAESSTRLVVFEGQVTASNDQGSLSLIDNEAAITFKDQAPQKEAIIHPTDIQEGEMSNDKRLAIRPTRKPGSNIAARPGNNSVDLSALRHVDSVLAKLPKGSATVTAPSEVLQYQGFDVSLRLAQEELAKLIDDAKLNAKLGETVQGISNVRMSPRMRAELVGEDFSIEDKGPQEQLVTLKEDTFWVWRVYSDMLGSRVLKVRLHTLLSINGKETPRTIEVAETEVVVKVNPTEWALRHWKWIITVLILPILGWGLKLLFDKGTKNQ